MIIHRLAESRTLMKHLGWSWAILLLNLPAPPTLAANKCIEPNGRIFYQAAPCPGNARGGDMSLNINRPFTGQVKRSSLEGASTATTSNATPPPQNPGEQAPAVRPNPDAAP